MISFFAFLLSILIGFLLSGIWFGLIYINAKIFNKYKQSWLLHLNPLIASIIPTFIIAMVIGIYPVQIEGIKDLKVYLVAIMTVLITTFFITRKNPGEQKSGKDLLIYGLEGAFMEIPQRLMMQSFVYGILKVLDANFINTYTIIGTAIIWCMGLIVQAFMTGKKLDRDTKIEILASFVFSLGMGYVYQRTGFILITMVAHFCERYLSRLVFNKK